MFSPALADAHWNRALVLLQRGDYAEGWANRPLRFCLSGNPWVSGPKPLR